MKTRKALAQGLKPIVVVNKIDRPGARPDWVLDQTFDLFDRLGATDRQLDFPVIYASALKGFAGTSPDVREGTMAPLFEAIVKHVPPPPVETLYNSEAFPRFTKGAPYTLPFNLTGAPAASMPAGLTKAGLPVGLQMVGPARCDHLVLRAMRAYESALGWTWPQPKVLETLAKL